MPTQVLCAILPAQFVEDPEDVLVVGLASGITAGALTLIPDIDRLDVVEIEPAIERAARIFEEHNHHVLDDPRVNLTPNDGRNHLLLTEEGTYDLIVSEPSNPWITGVSNLFTREFWEMGKRRLKDGGVWSQWIQMYGMDDEDLLSLLRTFSMVYEHVVVYATIEDADLVLVGSDRPILAGPDAAARLLKWSPELTAQLNDVGVNEALDVVSMLQLTRDDIMDMTEGAVLNTDDNMRIEYRAPKHLHVETSWNNMRRMMKHTSVPFAVLPQDPMLYADLARIYQSRDDVTRAWNAMAAAIGSLPPMHPVREEWKQELIGWQTEEPDEEEDVTEQIVDEAEELAAPSETTP
jgi:spermidine synthase